MPLPSNRPGKVYLDKPSWREMVAPYSRAPEPPTLRSHLATMAPWVWADRWECGCSKAIPLYPFVAKYGLDATLPDIRLKMRCTTCKKPPDAFSLTTSGRHGEFRFPPLDRVPPKLRGYARVDPTYLPAPLRG